VSVDLVEVVRSGFRECVHRGSVVVLDADGVVLDEFGEVHTPIYPRSTNKPMQAVALLRAGFAPADDAELAIASASHHGEPRHVAQVRRLLDRHGLREELLRCPAELPSDERARAEVLVSGARPRRVHHNCSGKHAAMLATCRHNDWPLDGYVDSGHPLQRAVTDTLIDLSGEPETELGIDGCGTPIVPISLVNLARTFAKLVTSEPGSPERRVADAVRAEPYLVSGTDGEDLLLQAAVPGLFCKAGAEGVHAGALPDGRAFALKIDDGQGRARLPLAAACLQRLGVEESDGLADLAAAPVLGGGARVGTIRAVPGLFHGA
jgi:L-asparaginase II